MVALSQWVEHKGEGHQDSLALMDMVLKAVERDCWVDKLHRWVAGDKLHRWAAGDKQGRLKDTLM